jgi:Flp pilus assembly pilin Flp
MQDIVHRTEAATRELGIRAWVALGSALHELGERAREQRGQTAAEYMGILLIVAVIIGAIFSSGLGGKISNLIGTMIDHISSGDKTAPAGGGN